MTGLAVFTIASGAVGAVLWLVFRGRRLERERDFERKVNARKSDWTYVGERRGRIDYGFAGSADGIDWEMGYDSDRGDKSPTPRAYWTSANLRTPGLALVIIGRRRFEQESGTVGRLLLGVVSGVAQAMTGREGMDGKAAFYESAVEIKTGRPNFQQRFAIAVAPDMPRAWVDDELQQLLLDWPTAGGLRTYSSEESLEVALGPEGLKIKVRRMPQDFAHWRHLARLGEHLGHRLAGAAAR